MNADAVFYLLVIVTGIIAAFLWLKKIDEIREKEHQQEKLQQTAPPIQQYKPPSQLKNKENKTPTQIEEFVPEVEANEWPKGNPVTGYRVRLNLTFSYTDTEMQNSRRSVNFFEQLVFRPERKFLLGNCQTSGEERIFNMRKMTAINDAVTGEIVEDVFEFVKQRWKDSPAVVMGNWFEKNSAMLARKGISHILRMHGTPSVQEYEIIIKKMMEATNLADITTEDIDDEFQITFPDKKMSRVMENIQSHQPDSWFLFSDVALALLNARGGTDADDAFLIEKIRKLDNRLILNLERDRNNWHQKS
jgi:hypothetical protein